MSKYEKLLFKVLSGAADTNVGFEELCTLVRRLGFEERRRGSHHVFFREGVAEIVNLQAGTGGKAKPYQVKQVRQIVQHYRLRETSDDE